MSSSNGENAKARIVEPNEFNSRLTGLDEITLENIDEILNEHLTTSEVVKSEAQEESKFYNIDGLKWWIPLNHQIALAVELESEDDYLEAIQDKLMGLIEQATVAERKAAVAPLGVFGKMVDVDNPWTMLNDLMNNGMVAEMLMEGRPAMDKELLDEDQRIAVIEEQEELDLGNFLAG
ncbi:hypothetical protein [Lutibacter sp.]|uniref:hypothetical protein n=1 Tax=Lutibacter sp. TaxID=1925666 RepID=UPI00273339C9|nr:hypothetical protein [Lutibacter sp.]MDP3311992.1 hypothetical protein [Lutibacter sp.]